MKLDVQCCRCGHEMKVDEMSRTWTRGIVSVVLVCFSCGHIERVEFRQDKRD